MSGLVLYAIFMTIFSMYAFPSKVMVDSKLPLWPPLLAHTMLQSNWGQSLIFEGQEPWPCMARAAWISFDYRCNSWGQSLEQEVVTICSIHWGLQYPGVGNILASVNTECRTHRILASTRPLGRARPLPSGSVSPAPPPPPPPKNLPCPQPFATA